MKRVTVLQRLDYVDADGLSIKMKGRCGCEVSATDCFDEIILENVLNRLTAAEV